MTTRPWRRWPWAKFLGSGPVSRRIPVSTHPASWPLYPYSKISRLCKPMSTHHIDLNDSVINFVAASFASLRKLDLKFGQAKNGSSATLRGLRRLAKHCPHLRQATLNLDPTQPHNALAHKHPNRNWDHGRRVALPELTLILGNLFSGDREQIVQRLVNRFPNLVLLSDPIANEYMGEV